MIGVLITSYWVGLLGIWPQHEDPWWWLTIAHANRSTQFRSCVVWSSPGESCTATSGRIRISRFATAFERAHQWQPSSNSWTTRRVQLETISRHTGHVHLSPAGDRLCNSQYPSPIIAVLSASLATRPFYDARFNLNSWLHSSKQRVPKSA